MPIESLMQERSGVTSLLAKRPKEGMLSDKTIFLNLFYWNFNYTHTHLFGLDFKFVDFDPKNIDAHANTTHGKRGNLIKGRSKKVGKK